MKITKSELKEMIREALREELRENSKKRNNERIAFMDFTGSSFQFEDLYKKQMRKDLGKNGVYAAVNVVEDSKMKALCDAVNSGADVILYTCDDDYKNNCPSIVGKANFSVKKCSPNKLKEATTGSSLDWDGLVAAADTLLDELIRVSGNTAYDDGDGYWQTEYTEWCNRYLYYTRLTNVAELEKLCDAYSKKLPNVEFYFYDDVEDDVSEIGYVASRTDG